MNGRNLKGSKQGKKPREKKEVTMGGTKKGREEERKET